MSYATNSVPLADLLANLQFPDRVAVSHEAEPELDRAAREGSGDPGLHHRRIALPLRLPRRQDIGILAESVGRPIADGFAPAMVRMLVMDPRIGGEQRGQRLGIMRVAGGEIVGNRRREFRRHGGALFG